MSDGWVGLQGGCVLTYLWEGVAVVPPPPTKSLPLAFHDFQRLLEQSTAHHLPAWLQVDWFKASPCQVWQQSRAAKGAWQPARYVQGYFVKLEELLTLSLLCLKTKWSIILQVVKPGISSTKVIFFYTPG